MDNSSDMHSTENKAYFARNGRSPCVKAGNNTRHKKLFGRHNSNKDQIFISCTRWHHSSAVIYGYNTSGNGVIQPLKARSNGKSRQNKEQTSKEKTEHE